MILSVGGCPVDSRPAVEWQPFDYDNKAAAAPRNGDLVWVYNATVDHVTLGYLDGDVFRMWVTFHLWVGSDNCNISHWALIQRPDAPGGR